MTAETAAFSPAVAGCIVEITDEGEQAHQREEKEKQ
jgi:hypothetical protein